MDHMFVVNVTLKVEFSLSRENVVLKIVKSNIQKSMRVQLGLIGMTVLFMIVSIKRELLIEHVNLDTTVKLNNIVLETQLKLSIVCQTNIMTNVFARGLLEH